MLALERRDRRRLVVFSRFPWSTGGEVSLEVGCSLSVEVESSVSLALGGRKLRSSASSLSVVRSLVFSLDSSVCSSCCKDVSDSDSVSAVPVGSSDRREGVTGFGRGTSSSLSSLGTGGSPCCSLISSSGGISSSSGVSSLSSLRWTLTARATSIAILTPATPCSSPVGLFFKLTRKLRSVQGLLTRPFVLGAVVASAGDFCEAEDFPRFLSIMGDSVIVRFFPFVLFEQSSCRVGIGISDINIPPSFLVGGIFVVGSVRYKGACSR
ncbi:unnamed protein product [Oikopleura dioica]|uniref:Uncharacterized protein n=1 Tax=Oikopleura dioica TaxID=34765 RepID=E4XEV9_OIKDI|nr:unnamed protein product [Oikopleura dioica]